MRLLDATCYNGCMSMPPGAQVAPYNQGAPAPAVITPTAVASNRSSAVFQLGQMLKTVIHNSRVFANEADLDNAVNVVDKFVGAFVPGSELPALLTGDERAAKEDVTQRVAPNTSAVVTGPVLDYTKLAQAILNEQERRGLTGGSASLWADFR